MPTYVYKCKSDGVFEVVQKMDDVGPTYPCPECGLQSKRVYQPLDVHYHADGFFTTDRKGIRNKSGGDKQDILKRQYEHHTGERAPEPARDVPKNGSEKY